MTDRQLSNVLDECLTLLTEEGLSVEACLARYPEHAAELRPLLELVMEMRRVVPPQASAAAFNAGKSRMLEALARNKEESRVGLLARVQAWIADVFAPRPRPRLAWQVGLVAAAAVLLIAVGGGLVSAWLGTTVSRTARVAVLQGEVQVRSTTDAWWLPASLGQRLSAGDRIRTGRDGLALVKLFDGSTTILTGETEITLMQLSSRRDGTAREVVLQQRRGRAQYDVKPLRRSTAVFQVKTPTAVTSVRGTTFEVAVEADGTTQVAVWRGLVDVEGLHQLTSGDTMVQLEPGWATNVQPDAPPSEPVAVPTPLAEDMVPNLLTPQPTATATSTATPELVRVTVTPSATPSTMPSATPSATPRPPSGGGGERPQTATPVPITDTTPTATPTTTPSATPTESAPGDDIDLPVTNTPTPKPTRTPAPPTATEVPPSETPDLPISPTPTEMPVEDTPPPPPGG